MAKKESEVNFQNFPKKEFKEIRNIIRSPENYYLVACDYGQLEVRVLTMASKDEKLIHDIWNGVDFHSQWANKLIEKHPDIMKLIKKDTEKEKRKKLRDDVKNNLVFAWFYGAGKGSVARHYNVDYDVPEYVMYDLYDEFWNAYSGVKKWQDNLVNFYNKNGYVESLLGRKRRMPLNLNKIINFPIQNTASFDICICSGDRLATLAYQLNKPQYQYKINVHDELVFYIPKETMDEDIFFITKEMVKPIYDDIIIVPLQIEVKLGTNWGSVEEVMTIDTTEWWNYHQEGKWTMK